MEVTLEQGVRKLTFNRPQQKNAIPIETYQEIINILQKDLHDDNVVVTIITAKGEYFSSGNDFKSVLSYPDLDATGLVENMIEAFIKYPKILIAVVNGPSIGISSTFITLCDIVYCSDKATFEIPFVRLGLSLEGCSSYLYTRILGKSKAAEMLFLNHILTAQEAYNLGFVAEVIPHEKLDEFIAGLHKFGSLPLRTVLRNKELFTRWSRDALLKINEAETKVLRESTQSEEFVNAIAAYMTRKSKL